MIADLFLCRIYPLWRDVFEELEIGPRFVHLLRHPWESAFSLADVEKIDIETGHQTWMTYNREAASIGADYPYVLMTFDQLIADSLSVFASVKSVLNLDYLYDLQFVFRDMLNLIRPGKKHFNVGSATHQDRVEFSKYFQFYIEFCSLRVTAPIVHELIQKRGETQNKIKELIRKLDEKLAADCQDRLKALMKDRNEKIKQLTDLQTQVEQLTKACDEQTKLADDQKSEIETLKKAFAAKVEESNAHQNRIAELANARHEKAKLAADRKSEIETLKKSFAEKVEESKAHQNRIAELANARDEKAKLAADRKAEIERLKQNLSEKVQESKSHAKASAAERRNPAMASFEKNPLRMIAFYLPQYHPIPENDEWWGKGFTEWRNVSQAKPLFTGHYQPHVPADLGFYDLRLQEARIAQADLARKHGIHGFCYYHYWFNGKRLLERPAEEMLASGKPDFPFCLCWANENWTRRWDGQDSSILMEQVYSEADDRAHIQDLFRFFTDSRYIRVNGKPLFLVYRTENMPDPARTAAVWREEALKAGIGDLYLVRVESAGCVNPHEIGFDASLEFAPDWDRMGPMVKSYGPDDPELPEIIDLPSDVYDNNYTRDYVELMKQMLKKDQPTYPWFRCVTPAWDNSARRSEKAVILLGSSPPIYQQWLENVISKTMVTNRPGERLVFINAWNEWAEGTHLEPCIKWGRSYLKATKSGIENGLTIYNDSGRLSDHFSNSSSNVIGKEGDLELAASLVKLMAEKDSAKAIIMSFEEFYNLGNLTYLKGWAAINDKVSTEGTDILILVHEPGDKVRVIIPAKRKRQEITAHFKNGCNYDFSGFEALTKQIDPNDNITVVIKRNGEMFWQSYR